MAGIIQSSGSPEDKRLLSPTQTESTQRTRATFGAIPVFPNTQDFPPSDVNQVKTKRNRTRMDDLLESPSRAMTQ